MKHLKISLLAFLTLTVCLLAACTDETLEMNSSNKEYVPELILEETETAKKQQNQLFTTVEDYKLIVQFGNPEKNCKGEGICKISYVSVQELTTKILAENELVASLLYFEDENFELAFDDPIKLNYLFKEYLKDDIFEVVNEVVFPEGYIKKLFDTAGQERPIHVTLPVGYNTVSDLIEADVLMCVGVRFWTDFGLICLGELMES